MRQDILFALHFLNSYPELSLGVNRRKTANEQHNDNYVAFSNDGKYPTPAEKIKINATISPFAYF